ncbi:hypothetical protein WA588_003115 [Blastocystis sp. NMH]
MSSNLYAWYAAQVAPYGLTLHSYLDYNDWQDGLAMGALVATVGIYPYDIFSFYTPEERHGAAYVFFEDELALREMYLTALRSALMGWYEQHPQTTAAKSSNYKIDSTTYKITSVNSASILSSPSAERGGLVYVEVNS